MANDIPPVGFILALLLFLTLPPILLGGTGGVIFVADCLEDVRFDAVGFVLVLFLLPEVGNITSNTLLNISVSIDKPEFVVFVEFRTGLGLGLKLGLGLGLKLGLGLGLKLGLGLGLGLKLGLE